jgi:hypothetical protein
MMAPCVAIGERAAEMVKASYDIESWRDAAGLDGQGRPFSVAAPVQGAWGRYDMIFGMPGSKASAASIHFATRST